MGHDVVVEISAEFTIEPFADGAPGPHVRAAIDHGATRVSLQLTVT